MFTIEEFILLCLLGAVVLMAIYALSATLFIIICDHIDQRAASAEALRRLDIGNDVHPLHDMDR